MNKKETESHGTAIFLQNNNNNTKNIICNRANLEVRLGELVAPFVVASVPLVHDLRDSDHLAVVIADGHADQGAAGMTIQQKV